MWAVFSDRGGKINKELQVYLSRSRGVCQLRILRRSSDASETDFGCGVVSKDDVERTKGGNSDRWTACTFPILDYSLNGFAGNCMQLRSTLVLEVRS